ncbi:hypothetical protein ACVJGD_000713 [Bradyrhizobium sp. USDA 10063]
MLTPRTQRRPEARMGEKPVLEPRRRPCEAGRGKNEERRCREQRQECTDKTDGDEEKTENKIDTTHQRQPSCKKRGVVTCVLSLSQAQVWTCWARPGQEPGHHVLRPLQRPFRRMTKVTPTRFAHQGGETDSSGAGRPRSRTVRPRCRAALRNSVAASPAAPGRGSGRPRRAFRRPAARPSH